MASDYWWQIRKYLANPHLWVTLLLLVIGLLLHYPQQLLGWGSPSLFSSIGLVRHAVERIYFLVPIAYASFFVGTKTGFVSLVIASAIMLPRVFLLSDYFPDALAETIEIIIIGIVESWWFSHYRFEKNERQAMLSNLKTSNQELQRYTAALEKGEKRLTTLNKISNTISQTLELNKVLGNAIDAVIDSVNVDAAWIYLLKEDGSELDLSAHRNYSEEYAHIKIGQGISGEVIQTGVPEVVTDTANDSRLPDSIKHQMASVVVVPMTSKGKFNGTLGVSSSIPRIFTPSDIDLLQTIGNQIGVAVENARLYQHQQEIMEQLKISEKGYRNLFESAQDAILVHDLNGKLTAANKATADLLGRDISEVVGIDVHDFLSEDSLHLAAKIKEQLIQGHTVEQPYEQHLVKKNGSALTIKITTNLLTTGGKPTGFLCIARDVTKEKETQDKLQLAYEALQESHRKFEESQAQLIQVEKLTSLGELAASVAHEVNNPIAGILIYNQLLIKKLKSDSFRKEEALNDLSRMESELMRVGRLIRSLLDFARQTGPCLGPVDMNDVLERTLGLVNHAAEMQHVKIIKELQHGIPVITADADQMNQVFINLTMNAIQAMPGGGTLTVRTASENGRIRVDVQDTGVGISKENMSKLFTPFFSTKKEVKGVGLGLAVSHGIIEQHKGKIEIVSEEGKGTTFIVYLNAAAI